MLANDPDTEPLGPGCHPLPDVIGVDVHPGFHRALGVWYDRDAPIFTEAIESVGYQLDDAYPSGVLNRS